MHTLMRYASYVFIILLGVSCRAQKDPLEITYIANEGFLVSLGETRVLVDALASSKQYASPSDSLATSMINGLPPFKKIDYVLVTHEHADHFNAEWTSRFLLHHPETQLIANQEVCSQLNGMNEVRARITSIELRPGEKRTIPGEKAEIQIVRLEHGGYPSIDNLAFVVRAGGRAFVHVGDAKLAHNEAALRALDWKARDVDVLFMECFDQSTPTWDLVDSLIQPHHVVFMHIPAGDEDAVLRENVGVHPGAIVFKREGETRRF